VRRECVFARGDFGHPIARKDLANKYQGGISFAGVLSEVQAKRGAELIESLESLPDVSVLTQIFNFPDKLN
jgi:hypothetical protein